MGTSSDLIRTCILTRSPDDSRILKLGKASLRVHSLVGGGETVSFPWGYLTLAVERVEVWGWWRRGSDGKGSDQNRKQVPLRASLHPAVISGTSGSAVQSCSHQPGSPVQEWLYNGLLGRWKAWARKQVKPLERKESSRNPRVCGFNAFHLPAFRNQILRESALSNLG